MPQMLYCRRALKRPSLLANVGKLLLMVLLALSVFSASAIASTSEIEGVWSFSGGSVAIQRLPNGTFRGTVVTPTMFSSCAHPVGQVMWTEITPQADGSYWGFHEWYQGSQCKVVPVPGPSAWRVLHSSAGSRYLKACFSLPGTSQPKIAIDGSETEATYSCVNSAPLASVPTTASFGNSITLPGGGHEQSLHAPDIADDQAESAQVRSVQGDRGQGQRQEGRRRPWRQGPQEGPQERHRHQAPAQQRHLQGQRAGHHGAQAANHQQPHLPQLCDGLGQNQAPPWQAPQALPPAVALLIAGGSAPPRGSPARPDHKRTEAA